MGKPVLLQFWTHQRCCPQWEDWDTQPHNSVQLDHPAARSTAHLVLCALPWGSPPLPTQKFLAVPLQNTGKAAWGQQTGQSTLRPCRNNRTCMGAAGPALALLHKPAGQRHRSGLVGIEQWVTATAVGKQGIALGEKEGESLLFSSREGYGSRGRCGRWRTWMSLNP